MHAAAKPNWTHRIRLLVLAALLMLSQLALVLHETDLEKHAPGGHCEWCIAASSLHAALGSQAWSPVADSLRHVHASRSASLVNFSFLAVYFSRAPPAFSQR